jgi:hypothetical protein
MKIVSWGITLFILFSLISCASMGQGQTRDDETSLNQSQSGPYYEGDGGKGMTLVVFEPTGKNFSNGEQWVLPLIQGVLNTDLMKYSAITIIDRQNLEKTIRAQEESVSGYYSDDDYVSIGKMTNAHYILTGVITKTPSGGYMLELAVTDIEKNERKASYGPEPCTAGSLENFGAIKTATSDLLNQLGIRLTDAGRENLTGITSNREINSQTALAQSIAAQNSGATVVEVLNYLYQAVDYDSRLSEAAQRLAATNNRLRTLSQPLSVTRTGNLRDDALSEIAAYRVEMENARMDAENKQVWLQTLRECEEYFADFLKTAIPSSELVYSPDIKRIGEINMEQETISLGVDAYVAPINTNWYRAAEKTVEAVLAGLNATGRKKAWGFEQWPEVSVSGSSPFSSRNKTINVILELIDENGRRLGSDDIVFSIGWKCGFPLGNLHFVSEYNEKVITAVFDNIAVNDITDTLTIRIAKVNEIDAETAARNGLLQIIASSGRVNGRKNWGNFTGFVTRNMDFDNWTFIPHEYFQLGYNYSPDVPIGFKIGAFGFYLSWNFIYTDKHGYSTNDRNIDDPTLNYTYTDRGYRAYDSTEIIYGFSINAINRFLTIPVGIGFKIATEWMLMDAEWFSRETEWFESPDGPEFSFLFEAGLKMILFKYTYVSAMYKLIGFEKSSYTIGGGFVLLPRKKD